MSPLPCVREVTEPSQRHTENMGIKSKALQIEFVFDFCMHGQIC